ncbi:MAG: hypothetical protein TEF_03715 [Rhizobiales bacterium NRL2]|nr:MAG: hypothetical protein TEF_03715 [Rhizobiales bacterium NRL2]
MSEETRADIGILGAGISGVLMGMLYRRAGMDDFVIHEKLPDYGGTWLRNTYPGLCCDVPSHLYSYSFEPNPDWSRLYASQPEIQRYIRACAERHDLPERTRFRAGVETACFDEDSGTWLLEDADGRRTRHRVLVAATGGLTAPRFPKIAGYDDFEGAFWHSGGWRGDVDLAGKRVAVVGSAASAVQVVPEVARRAARLTVFQRSPNWIVPRGNRLYTTAEKAAFRDRAAWRRHWRELHRRSLLLHRVFHRRPDAQAELRRLCLEPMRAAIADPALREALTPDYEPGCKRILFSDDYYSALARDHVTLVPRGVKRLSRKGVVDAAGEEHPADIVIFCTGYRLGGREDGSPAVEVYGRGGRRLADAIGERPEAWRGVSTPGFPNHFTVCGINGVAAYTSLFASAEINGAYIVRMTRRALETPGGWIDIDPDATAAYAAALQARLQQMSWAGDCTNFYKDAKGRILSFYPGTLGEMRRRAETDDGGSYRVAGG